MDGPGQHPDVGGQEQTAVLLRGQDLIQAQAVLLIRRQQQSQVVATQQVVHRAGDQILCLGNGGIHAHHEGGAVPFDGTDDVAFDAGEVGGAEQVETGHGLNPLVVEAETTRPMLSGRVVR